MEAEWYEEIEFQAMYPEAYQGQNVMEIGESSSHPAPTQTPVHQHVTQEEDIQPTPPRPRRTRHPPVCFTERQRRRRTEH